MTGGQAEGGRGASLAGSARPAALCACALVAGLVAAKATRDALFLNTFSAAMLPRIMTASAIASVGAVLLMARAMARFSPRRVLLFGLGVAGALVLLEWGLTFVMPRLAAVVVHLHVAIFGATLLSAFWSMINERFDPYTAKRVMGRIGGGAAVGGIVGGGLAYLAARSLPVPSMLLCVALLDLLAFALVLRLPRIKRPPSPGPDIETGAPEASVNLLAALRILREGSYLRHLAWVVFLGAFMESLLDYAFSAQAAATLPKGPRLAAFFAAYQTGVSVLAFLAQTLLTQRSLEALGLSGTVSLRPLAIALSSLAALFDPRLFTLLLARGGHAVLSSSLFRSGYELLFTPVPAERKRPTKAIIDVGFDKLGSVLGGLVTLAVVGFAMETELRVLLGLVIVAAIVSFLVTSWLNPGYVGALEASLRSGAVRLEPDEVKDATTRFFYTMAAERDSLVGMDHGTARSPEADPLLATIADLRSGQHARVQRALAAGRDPDPALVPFLIPLLAQDAVLGEVVKVLRGVALRVTGQLLDALLDPGQKPVVRRRIPRVLVAAPTPRVAEGLLRGLDDPRFDVRARCGLALLRIHERNPEVKVPRDVAFAAALRELQREGLAEGGDGVLGAHEDVVDHVFLLLSLVLEREPMQIASRALHSEDRALMGTALEYLETVLSDDLRRALWKRLQVGVRERGPARPSHEVLDELLRSSNRLKTARRVLRRSGKS